MKYKPFLGSNEKFDIDQLTYPLIVTIKKVIIIVIIRINKKG